MAGYIKATYRAGPVTVVERYYSPRYGVRAGRGQREKPTPERVAEVNERRSEFKLWLTLLENFKPGDLHLVLTYRKENRPADKSLGSLSHQGDPADLPPEAGQRAALESVQEPAEAPDHH